MRKLLNLSAGLLLSLTFLTTHAATRTASTNGNWSSTATWGGAAAPTTGDIAIIPAGITVTLDAGAGTLDATYAAFNFYNPSRIDVYGTLNVVGNSSATGGVLFENPIDIEVFSGGIVKDSDPEGAFNMYETSWITVYGGGSFYLFPIGGSAPFNTWIYDLNVSPLGSAGAPNEPYYLGDDGTIYNGSTAILSGPFTVKVQPSASNNNITLIQAVLPVHFISFAATGHGNNVNLNWVVGENQQAQTYAVYHATDGVNFSPIGQVTNNPNQTSYSFVHAHAGAGTHYYRILETDISAEYIYSPIVTAKLATQDFAITVLNNPARTETGTQLQLTTANAGTAYIELWSISGTRLSTQQRSVGTGTSILNLPMNHLPAGTYVVKIRLNNHMQVTQVLKQ